jgi:hypothetical protein
MLKKMITVQLAVMMAAYPVLAAGRYDAANVAKGNVEAASGAVENTALPAPFENLSDEQIDNLLAPIALYPDPLLAQILPASTFVDQVDAAARFLRANSNNASKVDSQDWEVSVKSIAHYPQVVYMMADKLDWTTALGQTYVLQSEAVLMSIQRLRKKAKDAGNLSTTPQQTVIVEKEVIKIVPAQPQVIYVPTYNPQVVYVQQGPSTGAIVATTLIAFGAGLAIGAWLNNDCDYYSHRVYYHGWRGTGWVSTSSVHIRVNNNYYVNNRYNTINVNRTVVGRPVQYNNINVYNNVSRNVNYNNINRNNINVNNVNRNNVNVNNVNRNNINQNNINRNNVNRNQVNNSTLNRNINSGGRDLNTYRGKTNTPANRPAGQTNRQTAPTRNTTARPSTQQRSTAFGGGSQTKAQSQRGQTSRSKSTATRSKPASQPTRKRN